MRGNNTYYVRRVKFKDTRQKPTDTKFFLETRKTKHQVSTGSSPGRNYFCLSKAAKHERKCQTRIKNRKFFKSNVNAHEHLD